MLGLLLNSHFVLSFFQFLETPKFFLASLFFSYAHILCLEGNTLYMGLTHIPTSGLNLNTFYSGRPSLTSLVYVRSLQWHPIATCTSPIKSIYWNYWSLLLSYKFYEGMDHIYLLLYSQCLAKCMTSSWYSKICEWINGRIEIIYRTINLAWR